MFQKVSEETTVELLSVQPTPFSKIVFAAPSRPMMRSFFVDDGGRHWSLRAAKPSPPNREGEAEEGEAEDGDLVQEDDDGGRSVSLVSNCATMFSMKKKRRAGATETFSVSVDARTKALLKARANRLYDGNMSQLITELGREAERRDAFERLREWVGGSVLTEEETTRIDRELQEGWKLARKYAKKARSKSAA